jgi:hypothetical protein
MKMKMVRTLMASKQGAEVNASSPTVKTEDGVDTAAVTRLLLPPNGDGDENGDVSAEDGDAENE